MKSFKTKKQKVVKPTPHVEHDVETTLSLNASTYLPKLPFIDPLAINIPNKGFARQKIILENMTRQIKKNQLPVMAIGILLLFAVIGGAIAWDRIGEPYMEAQQNFELKKLQGNLTSADKPPSLFNFKDLKLPGIPGVR